MLLLFEETNPETAQATKGSPIGKRLCQVERRHTPDLAREIRPPDRGFSDKPRLPSGGMTNVPPKPGQKTHPDLAVGQNQWDPILVGR